MVQDLFLHETAEQADVVLPALCFMEKHGTFMNIDGRLQRLHPGKELPKEVYSDGEIFARLGHKLGITLEIDRRFAKNLEKERIVFEPSQLAKEVKMSSRESLQEGEFLAIFAPSLFDHGVRIRHNPHLLKMVKRACVRIHPSIGKKLGIGDKDLVRVQNSEGAITAPVKLDSSLAEKTIVLPLGFPEVPVKI